MLKVLSAFQLRLSGDEGQYRNTKGDVFSTKPVINSGFMNLSQRISTNCTLIRIYFCYPSKKTAIVL